MEHFENKIYNAVFKVNHAEGSGSCFYLKKYDIFVTNYHVVEGFQQVAVQDNNKNSFLANVVLVNPKIDIALLKVAHDFSYLPDIDFSQESEIKISQKINVAGFPYGLPFTLTEGTVSSPKQMLDDKYFIQTDAAVNPGNSGGPMFNGKNELIAVTVSKLVNEADNMGFGIPIESLKVVLNALDKILPDTFNLQCSSCEDIIMEEKDYCPDCGYKLPKDVFKRIILTELAVFCEEAIADMGINPILARVGYEYWKFHKGSSEIRMFVYDKNYLFCTSPINILPKKNLEPVLNFLLSNSVEPYQLGIDDNQIYISYRVYIGDIFSSFNEKIKKNITNLAFKADELDNYLADTFGCEFSQHSKKDV